MSKHSNSRDQVPAKKPAPETAPAAKSVKAKPPANSDVFDDNFGDSSGGGRSRS